MPLRGTSSNLPKGGLLTAPLLGTCIIILVTIILVLLNPAHAANLPTTISAGSTISIDDTVVSGGTTLNVASMLSDAITNSLTAAVFSATRLTFLGTLTISLPGSAGGYTTIPLQVSIIDGISSGGASSPVAHLQLSGFLALGSTIIVQGGTYEYAQKFMFITSLLTVQDSSSVVVNGGTFDVFPTSAGSATFMRSAGFVGTNSANFAITNNTVTVENKSIAFGWTTFFVELNSGPATLSSSSAFSIHNNTVNITNFKISTANHGYWYLLQVFATPITLSGGSTFSVTSNIMIMATITLTASWNVYIIQLYYNAADSISGSSTMDISYNTYVGSAMTASASIIPFVTVKDLTSFTVADVGSRYLMRYNTFTASLLAGTSIPSFVVMDNFNTPFSGDGLILLEGNTQTFTGRPITPTMIRFNSAHTITALIIKLLRNTITTDGGSGIMYQAATATFGTPAPIFYMCGCIVGTTTCGETSPGVYSCVSGTALNGKIRLCTSTPTLSALHAALTRTQTPNTASHTLSHAITHTQPHTLTYLPPPPPTLPPPVQTYFGSGTYKTRYPDHTATQLNGVVSGIPLLFSTTFHALYAARFQATDVYNPTLRLGLDATAGTALATRLSLVKTTSAASFDGVSINAALCTQFVDPATGGLTNSSSVDCGTPMTCTHAPTSTSVGNHLTDSITVIAKPGALTATCSNSAPLSGIVYANVPITQKLFQSYALVSSNPSHADISATAAAAAFLSTPSQWLGPPTAIATGIAPTTTMYLVGNTANPSSTSSAPIVERYLAPVGAGSTTDLTATGGTTSYCNLPDQTAYIATYIAPNTTVADGGVPTSCFTYDSVAALHSACDKTTGCVGFSTVRVYQRELPLCLHLTGTNSQPTTYVYDRVFYRRPSTSGQACSVGVGRSGRVAVFIQQTSFGSGGAQAVVRVDGSVRAVCGGSQSFSNGFAGKSGRCQLFALCYAGDVSAGSTVVVAVQGTLLQNGCNSSLGVLVTQTQVDATQVVATTMAPIERVSLPGATSRIVRLAAGDTELRTLPLFVYGAGSSALEVTQSGFDCSLGGCSDWSVALRTAGSCQRCGGNTGFFRGGRAGLSDQCETGLFCGTNISLRGGSTDVAQCEAPALLPSPTAYSGVVRVLVDPTTLRARTSLCTGFSATMYTTPTSSTSSVPVFPLLGNNGTGFRTLLTAPSTLSATDAATYAAQRSGLPAASLTTLFTLGPFGSQVTALYASTLGATPQTTMHVNTTLACVVDHSAGESAKCAFPVPRNSLKMRVLVAQNDFALDANQLSVTVLSGSTVRASTRCGGSQRFGRESGAQQLCSDYRVCTDQYLYDNDDDASTAMDGYVTVEVPSHIRPRGCNFTASIIVEFTRPAVVVPYSCSTYECAGERKCLPFSAVCDSVQDCVSNVDEEWCSPWRPLDAGSAFCVPSEYTTNYTDQSYTDCRRLAAINSSSVFALIGTKCVVYSSSISSALLSSPTEYICPVDGATVHVRLAAEALSSFSLCTSSIQCGGNGRALSNTSGGLCTCTCSDGYTGTTCSERMSLSNIKTLVVALMTPPNMSLQVNLASLGDALALNSTVVTVACNQVLPSSLSPVEVYVECSVASTDGVSTEEYLHQRRLLSPTVWTMVTGELSVNGAPGIHFITARTSMQPILPVSDCIGASCVSSRPSTGLRIVSVAATALESTALIIGDSTVSSQRGQRRSVSCTLASTDVGGGCVSSACDIVLPTEARTNFTINSTVFAASDVTTGSCTSTGITLSSHEAYGDIATSTNDTVDNTETDYTGFLVGSITLFLVGWLIFGVVCAVFWCLYRRRLGTFTGLVDNTRMTPTENIKTKLLGHLAYIRHSAEMKKIRLDRVGLLFAVMSLLSAVAACTLTIYYTTAYNRNSNFSVMYEEYTDSLCSASPTASMPRRIFSVPHASTECTKMSVTGETAGVVYADGLCGGDGGSYSALLRTGGTFLTCMETPEITVVSGTCLPVSSIDPSDTRSVYVQLSCSTQQQISARTATLAKLTTPADVFVTVPTTALKADLVFASSTNGPPTTTTQDGTPIYQFPFLAGGNIKVSTSTHPMTVSSTATSANFDGRYDASRVVLQRFPDSFRISGVSMSVEETAALPLMADLGSVDAISGLRPEDGDYGVGYTFGGFGTSSELTWQGAGPQAHRHYDIRGTVFDVASHLPPSIDELSEGEGFSVSMFMRASNTTKGFAFAVTDAFENTQAGTVYPLDRLAEMIENGQASSAWYAHTYNVYAALYVSGPTGQLTFAHADPSRGERVEMLDWDLDRIGAMFLFNGLWHHVAVVYRVENGKLRATLMVDGSTSYAAEGWSVCADRLPPTVGTIPNSTAPVFDPGTDKVTEGGLLVVGYFNGGVYGLTVAPTEKINTDYLNGGTTAMREYNAFPRTKTLYLGAILTALGTLALGYLIVAGYMSVHTLRKASARSEGWQAMNDFLTLQRTATTSPTFFGADVDTPLTPIRLSTALRWSGLVLNQFAAVPRELATQTRRPGEHLLLLLYNSRTNGHLTTLTMGEWNALVEMDAEEFTASKRCFCLSRKTDAAADASFLDGGRDLFAEMMITDHTTTETGKSGAYSDSDDDVDHRGRAEGAAEVTNVDMGKGGDGGGMGDSVLTSLVDVAAPMIVVFQSMYLWTASIQFPSLYDDYFADIFSFVSIDVAMTFPGIPPIATPLAQMALGFLVVGLVIYFVFEDHRRFETSMVQYVWRRDALESTDQSFKLHESLPTELSSVLVDTTIAEPMIELTALPISECRALDLMTGRIPNVHPDDTTDYGTMQSLQVVGVDGAEYSVARDAHNPKELTATDSKKADNELSAKLDRIGCRCQRHPDVRLTISKQSDIFPFSNPTTCGCVVNGQLCGMQVGTMYSCGERYTNDAGDDVVCTYGLCEAHCRLSLIDTTLANVYGAKRLLQTNGVLWLLTIGIIFAINTIYTPFLKTALMILACHPLYQCEFKHCWAFMTQDFALAAFLSGSVVLVLGVGFPSLLFIQLYRRRAALNAIFFGAEYADQYVSADTKGPEYEVDNLLRMRKELSTAEWARFGAADNSALAQQYADAAYRWMMMPAIVLIFKVGILIPVVFLEPRSFELRVGSAAVEVFIAAFYFATSTQLSPILLMTIRAASVHQLLVLGLQNIDLVTTFDVGVTIAMALVAITLTYVAFSLIVFIVTVGYPLFAVRSNKKQVRTFLNRHGYDYSSGISLYIEPNGRRELTNERKYGAQDTKDMNCSIGSTDFILNDHHHAKRISHCGVEVFEYADNTSISSRTRSLRSSHHSVTPRRSRSSILQLGSLQQLGVDNTTLNTTTPTLNGSQNLNNESGTFGGAESEADTTPPATPPHSTRSPRGTTTTS